MGPAESPDPGSSSSIAGLDEFGDFPAVDGRLNADA